MTPFELRILLRRYIKASGTQGKAATQWGVSESYLSQVMHYHKEPSGKILKHLGIEREKDTHYRYERKKEK